MKKGILMILISLLTIVASYASDVDVTISVPEDYGIDFPAGLNLDRLYIAMENEKGDIEILTESDIDVGVAYDGDGDRIGVVDNEGRMLDIDKFMIIIWRDLVKTNVPKKTFYDIKWESFTAICCSAYSRCCRWLYPER